MSKLSVVLPAYNEELMVGKTCRVLAEVLTKDHSSVQDYRNDN